MDKVGDELATLVNDDIASSTAGAKMKEKRITKVVGGAGKVCTARGSRDRRIRLSAKTAILLYDVQDRLGCDRPSKAIDWLMKEAKAAIDALHVHSSTPPTNAADHHHHLFKFESSNHGETLPISGFGFSNGGPELQALVGRSDTGDQEYYDQQQFLSPMELCEANSEIVSLQSIFSWNYAADFHQGEPLQSSYSRINTNSLQFQGFGFPHQDLPNFKQDDVYLRHAPSPS